MNANIFNDYCRSKNHATYVNQWGGSHVWKIGGKVFAIGSTTKEGEFAVTYKVSPYHYDLLKENPGFRPAPYLASRGMKWIQQFDFAEQNLAQFQYYVDESYSIVASKLPKRIKRELCLEY